MPRFRITSTLRPNQVLGKRWIEKRISEGLSGLFLAPTGYGKSMMAYIIHLSKLHNKTLILVPTTEILKQFQNQLTIHTNLKPSHILPFHGPNRYSTYNLRLFHTTPIIITTYATLRQEFKKPASESPVYHTSFNHIILDEAHKGLVKTANISWKAVYAIKSTFVWPFSATPIVNSVLDIINIAKLARIESSSANNIVKNHSFSCQKDTTHIPKKHTIFHRVHSSGNQLLQYQLILHNTIHSIRQMQRGIGNFANVLAKITALRVASIHHRTSFDHNSLKQLAYPKFNHVKQLILDVPEGEHIIIFSNFTSTLVLLQQFLDLLHIPAISFHGKLSTAQNKKNLLTFKNSTRSTVLIANTKKAGVGLNLQNANHVIFLEPSWNAAETSQAQDRVYRNGQTKQTFIHHIYDHKSIELWIHNLALTKAHIHNQIIAHNHFSHSRNSEEFDLSQLFRFLVQNKSILTPPQKLILRNRVLRNAISLHRTRKFNQHIAAITIQDLVKHFLLKPGSTIFQRANKRHTINTRKLFRISPTPTPTPTPKRKVFRIKKTPSPSPTPTPTRKVFRVIGKIRF
jgi:SNF2 family DNA or RNA helicase